MYTLQQSVAPGDAISTVYSEITYQFATSAEAEQLDLTQTAGDSELDIKLSNVIPGVDEHLITLTNATTNPQLAVVYQVAESEEGEIIVPIRPGGVLDLFAPVSDGSTIVSAYEYINVWQDETRYFQVDLTTEVTEDLVIPIVQQTFYTVTFNSDGGSEVESQILASGYKVTQPYPDPTKEGVIFEEWQLNGVAYDFDTPVTGNITLVAEYRQLTPLDAVRSLGSFLKIEGITYEPVGVGSTECMINMKIHNIDDTFGTVYSISKIVMNLEPSVGETKQVVFTWNTPTEVRAGATITVGQSFANTKAVLDDLDTYYLYAPECEFTCDSTTYEQVYDISTYEYIDNMFYGPVFIARETNSSDLDVRCIIEEGAGSTVLAGTTFEITVDDTTAPGDVPTHTFTFEGALDEDLGAYEAATMTTTATYSADAWEVSRVSAVTVTPYDPWTKVMVDNPTPDQTTGLTFLGYKYIADGEWPCKVIVEGASSDISNVGVSLLGFDSDWQAIATLGSTSITTVPAGETIEIDVVSSDGNETALSQTWQSFTATFYTI